MKIIEVIETNTNLSSGETVINIEVENNKTSDVKFHFDWQWNSGETKKIVTDCYVAENGITLFNDGTKIKLPSWQLLDISMFAHGNINNKYIENLIN